MKINLLLLMITIGFSSIAFGQTKLSKDPKVEAEIIALERAGWEAWKNKSPVWFQANTTDEVMSINSAGVSSKSQMINDLAACEVKSFAIDNFNFVMTGSDSAVMTYTALQDGVCGGEKIPSQVRSKEMRNDPRFKGAEKRAGW